MGSHRITAKESFGKSRCPEVSGTPLTTFPCAEIINAFLHYLAHYQILSSDPALLSSLHKTLSLSTQMLQQITIAQHLSDALPGTAIGSSWHALALNTWVLARLGTEEEWKANGERMQERVEALFTDARAESMARNVQEGEEAAKEAPTGPDETEEMKEAAPEQGEGEGYVYVDDGEEEVVVADWENAEVPGERLTHAQGSFVRVPL